MAGTRGAAAQGEEHAAEAGDEEHRVVAEEGADEADEGGATQPEDHLLRSEGDLGLVVSDEVLGGHVRPEAIAQEVGVPDHEGDAPEDAHREDATDQPALDLVATLGLVAATGVRGEQPGQADDAQRQAASLMH